MADNDLITTVEDTDFAALLDPARSENSAEFRQLIGEAQATTILEKAAEQETGMPAAAGISAPPDMNLPEIVLLHGITDSHLADVSGKRNRIWLDPFDLVLGRFTRRLPLQEDGVSDQPDVEMVTDGYVDRKYAKALQKWKDHRFRTQVYCYDWRQHVEASADGLNAFLEQLPSVGSGEKVVLVCHSMGGLVAAAYAARHANWEERIAHCVFVGTPLGGSYSVPMAVLGKSESFKKMALISVSEGLADFQRMAANFPGLVDMLPNPEVFPEAADFYKAAGWPGSILPSQASLDASRQLKDILWTSPILKRATHLVAQGNETVAEMPWNADHSDRDPAVMSLEGDGAVLTKSSLVPNLPAYRVSKGTHGMLVVEPETIDAVMQIAQGHKPNLPPITLSDLTGSTQAAGLAMPAGGLVVPEAPDAAAALGVGVARHYSSTSALEAQIESGPISGFDRLALRSTQFSWKNALSMAIASAEAYEKTIATLETYVLGSWGFEGFGAFDAEDSQGFVCWDDEVVVLSFRGTQTTIADWLRNLTIVPHDTGPGGYGTVHKGFYEGYDVVRDQVEEYLSRADAAGKKLYVTGHSLGGALATIAGGELWPALKPVAFYTYGQPSVGRSGLQEFYEENYPDSFFRFVNHRDIVTRIPPNYGHIGSLFWFNADGTLKAQAAAGLAMGLGVGTPDEPPTVSEEEFAKMQEELDAVRSAPAAAGGLSLPPTDEQIEARAGMSWFGVSDHSIRDEYIPKIKQQLPS